MGLPVSSVCTPPNLARTVKDSASGWKNNCCSLSLHMATNNSSSSRNFIEGLTFDDVLLVPAYSEILPREVEIKTRLTKDITLHVPMLSAAMDTVTEANLAIALARE